MWVVRNRGKNQHPCSSKTPKIRDLMPIDVNEPYMLQVYNHFFFPLTLRIVLQIPCMLTRERSHDIIPAANFDLFVCYINAYTM